MSKLGPITSKPAMENSCKLAKTALINGVRKLLRLRCCKWNRLLYEVLCVLDDVPWFYWYPRCRISYMQLAQDTPYSSDMEPLVFYLTHSSLKDSKSCTQFVSCQEHQHKGCFKDQHSSRPTQLLRIVRDDQFARSPSKFDNMIANGWSRAMNLPMNIIKVRTSCPR